MVLPDAIPTGMKLQRHTTHTQANQIAVASDAEDDAIDEPQLDERLHVDAEEKIKDRVDVEERELQLAVDDRVGAHVVVQQAVEAHELEAQLAARARHHLAPISSQRLSTNEPAAE